jgi:hypothetical protein
MNRAIGVILLAIASHAAPCPTPRDVPRGASLQDLANRYLGNSRFAIAIALSTNARSADGLKYISNPDDLTGIKQVCIPTKSEARLLLRSWETYDKAVTAARLPRLSNVSKELVSISPEQPVTVVAWVRKDQADNLKTPSGGWVNVAAGDTWVTVEPHLQQFCSAFARERKPDEAVLTRRLEQRLGLACKQQGVFRALASRTSRLQRRFPTMQRSRGERGQLLGRACGQSVNRVSAVVHEPVLRLIRAITD